MGIYKREDDGIPSEGLLGLWKLQSDLLDYSGNNNNGSRYSGTGSFSSVANKTGARVTTNNPLSTQHIITPLTYNNNPITVCGWICYNTMNTNNWHGLMSSATNSTNGNTIGTRPTDNNYPSSYVNGGPLRIMSSTASTNTWYFWCATNDGTTHKVYNNGVLVASGTAGDIRTGQWKLGCAMVDGGQSVNSGTDGWIRYCAIYNRVLTADEVLAFYNATI